MSATAMQDMTKPEERLSISEYGNDDKPGVAPKGGTAFDEQEMRRMGKVQELRVSLMAVTVAMSEADRLGSVTSSSSASSGSLRSCRRRGRAHCLRTLSAWSTEVSLLMPLSSIRSLTQLRHRRCHLVHNCRLAFDAMHDCLDGGDGLDVSNGRR